MKSKFIGIIADKNEKAQEAMAAIESKYDIVVLNDAKGAEYVDIIIALGGDGFMLHILHDYIDFNIPIYGMNCGTVGFLMNGFETDNLLNRIENARKTRIHPLIAIAKNIKGQIKEELAFNEVSLLRKTGQAAKIAIYIDNHCQLEEMVSDGILVSTPAGSSAYNFSVGGSIVPIRANILAITPISPFRPRRWRGALLPNNVTIRFDILESKKRPVNAVADFRDIKDIASIEIKEDKDQYVELLFDPGHSLEERILREQFIT